MVAVKTLMMMIYSIHDTFVMRQTGVYPLMRVTGCCGTHNFPFAKTSLYHTIPKYNIYTRLMTWLSEFYRCTAGKSVHRCCFIVGKLIHVVN